MNSINVILLKHIKLQSGSSLIELILDQEIDQNTLSQSLLTNDLYQLFQEIPMSTESFQPSPQASSSFPQKNSLPAWLCQPSLRCRLPFHYQGDKVVLEIIRCFQNKLWTASYTPSLTLSHKLYSENSVELHYYIEKKEKFINYLSNINDISLETDFDQIKETDLLKLIYKNTLISAESPIPKSLNSAQLNAAQKLINKYHSNIINKKSFVTTPTSPLPTSSPLPRSSSASSASSASSVEDNSTHNITSLNFTEKVEKTEKKKKILVSQDQTKPQIVSTTPSVPTAPVTTTLPSHNNAEVQHQVTKVRVKKVAAPEQVPTTTTTSTNISMSLPPPLPSTPTSTTTPSHPSTNTTQTVSPSSIEQSPDSSNQSGELDSISPSITNVPLTTRRASIKGKVLSSYLKRRSSVSSANLNEDIEQEKTLLESTSSVSISSNLPPSINEDLSTTTTTIKPLENKIPKKDLNPIDTNTQISTSSSSDLSPSTLTTSSTTTSTTPTSIPPIENINSESSSVKTIESPLKGVEEVNILEKITDENFEIAYSSKADQVVGSSGLRPPRSIDEFTKEHEASKTNHYARLGSTFVVTQSQNLLKRGGRGTPGAGRGTLGGRG